MFILWMHNIGFVADTSSADVSKFSLADADMCTCFFRLIAENFNFLL